MEGRCGKQKNGIQKLRVTGLKNLSLPLVDRCKQKCSYKRQKSDLTVEEVQRRITLYETQKADSKVSFLCLVRVTGLEPARSCPTRT